MSPLDIKWQSIFDYNTSLSEMKVYKFEERTVVYFKDNVAIGGIDYQVEVSFLPHTCLILLIGGDYMKP